MHVSESERRLFFKVIKRTVGGDVYEGWVKSANEISANPDEQFMYLVEKYDEWQKPLMFKTLYEEIEHRSKERRRGIYNLVA